MRAFLDMARAGDGLGRLLALMPEGSTLADARRLHRRTKQRFRQPCGFLDRELGIERDPP